jgi:predicted RNA-binding protein
MLHKKKTKKIGVCVDESVAYLLLEKNEDKIITIIEADAELDDAYGGRAIAFSKRIFDLVKDFDKIFLFGPERVKRELLLRIKTNKLKIEIQHSNFAETITDHQKYTFINEYFAS